MGFSPDFLDLSIEKPGIVGKLDHFSILSGDSASVLFIPERRWGERELLVNFVFKMMNFVFTMMDFVFTTMNFV